MSQKLISREKVSLLDVGAGPEGTAQAFFPEAVIFRLDVDPEFNPDYVHDIRAPFPEELRDRFDVVFASHVLEHVERHRVPETVANLRSAVRDGGELWILVPSLEWVAKELRKDQPSPAVLAAIYGAQSSEWQYHKSGFTLFMLRQIVEKAGLVARQAYQGPLTISLNGKPYDALQNILVSMRNDNGR
ncbi:MAG: methyltransferase domain-containing protein [Anaerolineales bacterium]